MTQNLSSLPRGNHFFFVNWAASGAGFGSHPILATAHFIRYMLIIWSGKISGPYPESGDPKITRKGTLTYPINYMIRSLRGDFIDIQGDKNTSTDKKNPGLTFGQLFK